MYECRLSHCILTPPPSSSLEFKWCIISSQAFGNPEFHCFIRVQIHFKLRKTCISYISWECMPLSKAHLHEGTEPQESNKSNSQESIKWLNIVSWLAMHVCMRDRKIECVIVWGGGKKTGWWWGNKKFRGQGHSPAQSSHHSSPSFSWHTNAMGERQTAEAGGGIGCRQM